MQPTVQRVALDARLRRLTVQRVEELGAGLRRVALGGPDLEGFVCDGPTDHAKVFFPAEPDGEPALPVMSGEGRWTDRQDPRYVCREYTVRTYEPSSGELVLDMAVHGHGPAGRWAAAAEPGRVLGVYGPKTSKLPPLDLPRYVLVADETGLPAVTNWLDRLADRTGRVDVVVEVDGPQHEVPLPVRDGVTVTWLHRGTGEATEPLATAVDRVLGTLPADDVPRTWFWAGAEAAAVREVRRRITDRGGERSMLSLTGYWRRGVANFDHKSPDATA